MKLSVRVILSLLPCALALWGCPAAESQTPSTYQPQAEVSGMEMYQIGGNEMVVNVNGKSMPAPEIFPNPNGSTTVIFFRNSRMSQALNGSIGVETVPMLNSLHAEQVNGGVAVTAATGLPIRLTCMYGTAPSDAYTLRFAAEEQRAVDAEAAPQTSLGQFASYNTPININFRDADIKDAFMLLSLHIKKNIIIDDSMPRRLVNMEFKDVPACQVYEYLMRVYGLSCEMLGENTIVVGTADGLAKSMGIGGTQLFHVAYADAAKVRDMLPRLTDVPKENIVLDERRRTIYVRAAPEKLKRVAAAMRSLDRPGKQVMLQARILQFTKNASKEVEAIVNAVYDHWWLNYSRGAAAGGYSRSSGIIGVADGMNGVVQGVLREFDASISAMEEKNLGTAIAAPSLITIDGHPAVIDLSEEYPYVSDRTEYGKAVWSSKTVGPTMEFTPLVGRNGLITIKLDINAREYLGSWSSGGDQVAPRTGQRRVISNVRVRDGEPFVVGGLMRDNLIKNTIKVPVLASIPFFGELFKYNTKRRDNTQVIMVVVPFILDTPDTAVEEEHQAL
jgi:type IV pilus assembly protein PilQ